MWWSGPGSFTGGMKEFTPLPGMPDGRPFKQRIAVGWMTGTPYINDGGNFVTSGSSSPTAGMSSGWKPARINGVDLVSQEFTL